MGTKVRVDVELVHALRNVLREINKIDLEDIEWFKDNAPLNVKPEAVKEFSFIGLNNSDFIDFLNPETGLLNVVNDNEEEENNA